MISTATTTSKKGGSRKKAIRSKKVQADDVPSGSFEESLAHEGDSIVTVGTTTSKPGRPKKAKAKAPAKRNTRNTRAKKDSVIDEPSSMNIDLQDPMDYEEPPSEPEPRQSERPKRGAKRAPKQQPEDSSLIVLEEPPKPKTTRTRKQKQPEATSGDPSQLPQDKNEEMSMKSKRVASAPKRGKKRSSDGREKEESSIDPHSTKSETPLEASATNNISSKAGQKEEPGLETQDRYSGDVETADPDVSAPQAKKGRGRPSKQKQKSSSLELPAAPPESENEQEVQSRHAGIDRLPVQELRASQQPVANQETTKPESPSPQSSDAENHPPSSRPSKTSKQVDADNEPTAPVEIRTPVTSPSKHRRIAEGLKTLAPWDPVDLETAFLLSPPMSQDDKQREAYEKMYQMTTAEKRMTVGEWILWNAGKAEEKLKNQCEGMISTFEREGMRALRSVEGIESA